MTITFQCLFFAKVCNEVKLKCVKATFSTIANGYSGCYIENYNNLVVYDVFLMTPISEVLSFLDNKY